MSKIVIDKLEFYITNVCNLTCSNCNRYNNYKFQGWQAWEDYSEVIKQWSEKIDVKKLVILGGEPLLNPTINEWITGLSQAWPNAWAPEVISNGARIDQVKGLYESCLSTRSWIGISIHQESSREQVFNRIRNFLKAPIAETKNSEHPVGSDYQFYDANNMQVHVWDTKDFLTNNIIELGDGRRTLYNSDPERAHKWCPFVVHKNYHFIRGKFYKCGPVALMPEFDQQYPFELSDADRELLYAGRGLGVDEFDEYGEEFFANIDKPIPQCKFCPESQSWQPIQFSDLKPNKI